MQYEEEGANKLAKFIDPYNCKDADFVSSLHLYTRQWTKVNKKSKTGKRWIKFMFKGKSNWKF